MDTTYPNIDSTQFSVYNWSEFNCNVEEPIQPNAPEATGKVMDLHMFIDGDHAGDQFTQKCFVCFLMYLDSSLISWYSKRQSTIQKCTFSAEFLAVKTGTEIL